MKISVIMPVYNCENYIEAAVKSVLGGGVEDIELIAIDDCSGDRSWEILSSLADQDSRIRAYRHKQNTGVSAVRNEALALASGEYVAFCDSDDTVAPGGYSALLGAIGDSDIAVGAYEDLTDTGHTTPCPINQAAKASPFLTLFAVCCLWTKLIRREFIVKNRLSFDQSVHIGEDVIFLANVAACHPTVKHTDECVYSHIYHDLAPSASLTHIYTRAAFSEHITCRKRLLSICAEAGIDECPKYVFEYFSGDLDKYLFMINDRSERADAYREYLELLDMYDWTSRAELFRAIHGLYFSDMKEMTVDQYEARVASLTPRERVEAEFNAGIIGMRWILRYIKGWLKFKLKCH